MNGNIKKADRIASTLYLTLGILALIAVFIGCLFLQDANKEYALIAFHIAYLLCVGMVVVAVSMLVYLTILQP